MPNRIIDPDGDTILLARISEEERAKRTYNSTRAQLDDLTGWAATNGWRVAVERWDEGYSAGEINRPELQAIINEDARNPRIKRVICSEYGRFGGSVEFLTIIDKLRKRGVEVIAKYDPISHGTASGELQLTILMAFKRFQIKQTAEKISTKNRMRAEKGLWHGGFLPWGFTIDAKENNLVPQMEFAPLVATMHYEFIRTGSDIAVADWLNHHKITMPAGVSAWNRKRVEGILTSCYYAGLIRCHEALFSATFEAMIPRALWERSMQRRAQVTEERRRGPKRALVHRTERVFLLAGVTACGHEGCGGTLTPYWVNRRDRRYYYYLCARKQHDKSIAHVNRIPAERFETWLLEQLAFISDSPRIVDLALHEKLRALNEKNNPYRDDLARKEYALRECEKQMSGIVDALATKRLTQKLVDAMNTKFETLSTEQGVLRHDCQRLRELVTDNPFEDFDRDEFLGRLRNYRELMTRAQDEQRRDVVRKCVRQVRYDAANGYGLDLYAGSVRNSNTHWYAR